MARKRSIRVAPQAGVRQADLKVGGLYLLCFDRPLILGINVRREVRHYCGASVNVLRRLQKHATNPDARIMQLAKDRGITWRVVRVWLDVPGGNQGTRWAAERRLKGISAGRLCPCCHPGTKRGCVYQPATEHPPEPATMAAEQHEEEGWDYDDDSPF